MRIKFLKTVMAERAFFKADSEAEVHDETAREYVRVGYAVPCVGGAEVAAPRKPVEKAVRPIRGAQRGA